MNSQTRKAHLKLLGPAPAGMKWVALEKGDKVPRSYKVVDVAEPLGGGKYISNGLGGDGETYQAKSVSYPHMRFWHLVPVSKPTYFDALATFRRIMGRKLEDLDRDQADAIVADFIGHHCRKEDFVAYVKAAKKGLKV